ncbi:diphthine--ammonia ligase [Alkalibacillus haloalkaliphilus]|uniref:Dph6-related ATP pyrophosphatase n=1 Tax=Alkalibacillus haloalkaliphilus TaxID=94136 RepID=UPI00293656A3|nr:diphthine--ammonia ligase [Alkalibacillus haloalkaliphilus]MDV2581723.1 diphthine--ammonia ligase [Alkalibacillus haloalkaliphilus]
MKRVAVSHSGGKDSMLALHRIMQRDDVIVDRLITTVNEAYNRTSVHGNREELLEMQAEALNLPLQKIYLPESPTNEQYNETMINAFKEAEADGITHIVYGDINLADVKAFREQQLEGMDLEAIFPLWLEPTNKLIDEFLQLGYKTIITTIDPSRVPTKFLGAFLDCETINALPDEVDICGENGEFHTFVVDGPLFKDPLHVKLGDEVVEGDFYTYRDVVRDT